MEEKLKIAVFIDFDNIEIGVKSTLQREFDVAAVLDAFKERGEIVTKVAYANWGRLENSTRALAEHAVQMVQRDPSPRGDKNGADINLALDALEMAFTHDHINAFAIVSGDSDFIALVNKLKQYDKRVFVLGGRAFTSTILQRNCHEFISYESLLDEPRQPRQQHQPQHHQGPPKDMSKDLLKELQQKEKEQKELKDQGKPPQQQQPQQQQPQQQQRRQSLDIAQAMPLVDRALQSLERREVRPQLGLLKSTMLQLDSTFNEKAYGASSFTDFIERLQKAGFVQVTGGEGRYMIKRKGSPAPEKNIRPEEALPYLRDVLETHRMDVDSGVPSEELAAWVKDEQPGFEYKDYGFQEFSEFLNFAQDKSVVKITPDEERGLTVFLGAEFHPPAPPEPPPAPEPTDDEFQEEEDEPQPYVAGQPTIFEPNPPPAPEAPVKKRAPRPKRTAPIDPMTGKPKVRSSSSSRPRKKKD